MKTKIKMKIYYSTATPEAPTYSLCEVIRKIIGATNPAIIPASQYYTKL